MFRKLFWGIIEKLSFKFLRDYFRKKKDGDKPKTVEKPPEKTRFNTSRLEWREIERKKKEKK